MVKIITKILIANRGEIAVRVIRSAHDMGINTVSIYSDVDAQSPHVLLAREAVGIGGSTSAESYLDIDKIIKACKISGADAIHPGYGFLSENAGFAARCESEGIIFIGPSAQSIQIMGDKLSAKTRGKSVRIKTSRNLKCQYLIFLGTIGLSTQNTNQTISSQITQSLKKSR